MGPEQGAPHPLDRELLLFIISPSVLFYFLTGVYIALIKKKKEKGKGKASQVIPVHSQG